MTTTMRTFERELTKAKLAIRRRGCAAAHKALARAEKLGEKICTASGSTRSEICIATTRRYYAADQVVDRAVADGACSRRRRKRR